MVSQSWRMATRALTSRGPGLASISKNLTRRHLPCNENGCEKGYWE